MDFVVHPDGAFNDERIAFLVAALLDPFPNAFFGLDVPVVLTGEWSPAVLASGIAHR